MRALRLRVLLCLMVALSTVVFSCKTMRAPTNSYSVEKAKRIEETLKALKNKKIPMFIKEWTGTPYKLGGLDKKGIDCSGFVQIMQQQLYGNKLVRRSKDQSLQINAKRLNELKEGDLIFFSFSGKEIDHVGVYLKDNYFVHASTTKGVIVDDLNLKVYQNSIVLCGSVKKNL